MNEQYGLTRDNILATAPYVLTANENLYALVKAAASVLAKHFEEEKEIIIYPRIQELPEPLLDILAKDFKIDWWSGDYTLQEKRDTMSSAWAVYSKIGTKKAVEDAISSIYYGSSVTEWFEYSGEPYHFKVLIDMSHQSDTSKYNLVISKVCFYKNLRSVFDGVEFVEIGSDAIEYGSASAISESYIDSATAY